VRSPVAASHAIADGACPSEWRHGWKWSLTKTLSKPFSSAAMEQLARAELLGGSLVAEPQH